MKVFELRSIFTFLGTLGSSVVHSQSNDFFYVTLLFVVPRVQEKHLISMFILLRNLPTQQPHILISQEIFLTRPNLYHILFIYIKTETYNLFTTIACNSFVNLF